MGSGEFGSNGSVHWKIVHTADEAHQGFVRGRDPSIPGNMKGLHVVPKFSRCASLPDRPRRSPRAGGGPEVRGPGRTCIGPRPRYSQGPAGREPAVGNQG